MTTLQIIRMVAGREMRERIKSRSFIVSNVVTVLVLLGAVILIPIFAADDPVQLGLAGEVPDGLEASIEAVAAELDEEIEFKTHATTEAGVAALETGEVGALLVDADELVFEEEQSDRLVFIVNTATAAAKTEAAIAESGVTADQIAILAEAEAPIAVRSLIEPEEENFFNGFGGATVGVILMFMAITLYGNTVLMGVLEEKTTRVVEVILSTVRPWHLLAGKVVGLGLLGLFQLALMLGIGVTVAVITDLTDLPEGILGSIGWILLWFILGYTFYAVLYAMGGAMAGKLEDAQSTAAPAGFLVLIGYLFSFIAVLPNPDGLVAKISSVLPPFAPFAMPALIALGEADLWQIVLSIGLMVAAIYGTIRLAGRIYSGGLLGGGERLKLRDAWRAATDVGA